MILSATGETIYKKKGRPETMGFRGWTRLFIRIALRQQDKPGAAGQITRSGGYECTGQDEDEGFVPDRLLILPERHRQLLDAV